MKPSKDIARLIEIMAALRTPGTGCPWDLEQSFRTIAPYTIEEAYEVADAIERGDFADLKDELGDLLLQVVYHARMAEETGAFAFGDVVEAITAKMIRRHPHVFGDATARDAGAVRGFWERIKAEEKAEKVAAGASNSFPPPSWGRPGRGDSTTPDAGSRVSLLDEVPVALPALARAIKLQDKAAKVGFDWPSLAPVFAKLREEIDELAEIALPADPRAPGSHHPAEAKSPSPPPGGARPMGSSRAPDAPPNSPPPGAEGSGLGGTRTEVDAEAGLRAKIEEELGDLLFVVANVARHLKLDPETALRAANAKFIRRFGHIEARLAAQGRTPEQSDLAEMDALWDEAKAKDRN